MAFETPILNITRLAGADLSSDQYKFVKLDGDGKAILADSLGESVVGVLQNDPDAVDKSASVMVNGVTKIEAGATIDENDQITTDASGTAGVAGAGNYVVGIALEPAASGEVFSMLIVHAGQTS